jgi:hypothetical protein
MRLRLTAGEPLPIRRALSAGTDIEPGSTVIGNASRLAEDPAYRLSKSVCSRETRGAELPCDLLPRAPSIPVWAPLHGKPDRQ